MFGYSCPFTGNDIPQRARATSISVDTLRTGSPHYTRTLLIMYALHITSLLRWPQKPCLDFRAYFVATSASCLKRLRRVCGSKVAFYGSESCTVMGYSAGEW